MIPYGRLLFHFQSLGWKTKLDMVRSSITRSRESRRCMRSYLYVQAPSITTAHLEWTRETKWKMSRAVLVSEKKMSLAELLGKIEIYNLDEIWREAEGKDWTRSASINKEMGTVLLVYVIITCPAYPAIKNCKCFFSFHPFRQMNAIIFSIICRKHTVRTNTQCCLYRYSIDFIIWTLHFKKEN